MNAEQQQQRAEWLEWRRGGLGGSDVAAILGLSPWSGPWDVYLSKVEAVDGGDSAAMERGRRFERAVGEWAAELLGVGQLVEGAPLEDQDDPWIRGTPDFYLQDLEPETLMEPAFLHEPEGLECKTTRYLDPDAWGEPGTHQIPISYRIQCIWYLRLSGLERWNLAVWSTLQDRLELYVVERDLEVETALVARARQWWERHVLEGEPPRLDGSDAAGRYLRSAHPDAGDVMLDATATDDQVADRIRELQRVEKVAQLERKELENQLKSRIGDARGIAGEWGTAKWSRYTSQRLDAKRLRKERKDLAEVLDDYTKESPASRLWLNWKDKQP